MAFSLRAGCALSVICNGGVVVSITIEDILTLKSAQSFTLVAGKGGLTRPIKMVDILDFGWDKEKEYSATFADNSSLFDEDSFVISSLMFANNDTNKLYQTVLRLIMCGVSGLAFKPVFYATLPSEICELANEKNFSIFRIEDNVTYREIICDISDAIKLNQDIMLSSGCLSRMLHEKLSMEDLSGLVARISNHFRGNARVTLIVPEGKKTDFSIDQTVRNFRLYDEFTGKAALCGFTTESVPGLALIVTADASDASKFDVITNHALTTCGMDHRAVRIAHSDIHPTFTALNRCVIEAHQSLLAGRVLGKSCIHYRDIGTLSFLIPSADNSYVRTYMQTFLAPIVSNEENINTAVAFVRAEGDFDEAARSLCLHKNTLRYRIKKIHKLLSPELSDEAFYESLATAIKIHMICQLRN